MVFVQPWREFAEDNDDDVDEKKEELLSRYTDVQKHLFRYEYKITKQPISLLPFGIL